MSDAAAQFVSLFRDSAPYIEEHRGRTFVLAFSGEVVASEQLVEVLRDIKLTHALGVRWVVVHGARPQIDAELAAANLESSIVDGLRVTSADAVSAVATACGKIRHHIEASLSKALGEALPGRFGPTVVSGNLVSAKPRGVVNGTDYQHTGEVSRLLAGRIHRLLDQGNIVLLSPLGYSPTGECYNLGYAALAAAAAEGINADKLIFADLEPLPDDITELAPADAAARAGENPHTDIWHALGQTIGEAVPRGHVVNLQISGALLRELYTRDGAGQGNGLLVTGGGYDELRPATVDDVGGLLEVIGPLENAGILVPRSQEDLELQIDRFTVIERDGRIIACAALFVFPDNDGTGKSGELACLAVHRDYRGGARGDQLLKAIRKQALVEGLSELFALTTQSEDWFRLRGFQAVGPDALPVERKDLYNWRRGSKVFAIQLQN